MRRSLTIVFGFIFLISLIGCQKELSFENKSPINPVNLLPGIWKFSGLTAEVESASGGDFGGIPGKIIASYKASSQNNSGTFTIALNTMEAAQFGYTLSGKVSIFTYLGGIPVDPQPAQEQLDFVLPPDSVQCEYQAIGSDSVFFPKGFPFDIPDTNGQPLMDFSDSIGATFKINSDTLIIKSAINKTTIIKLGDEEIEHTQKVNRTATLLRQ